MYPNVYFIANIKICYMLYNITTVYSENVIYEPVSLIELFVITEMFCICSVHYNIYFHMWLLIAWNMANVNEKLNFDII